jgi:SAM-dependent methyltransferase
MYAKLADRCLRQVGGRRMLDIGFGHGFTLARLERRYETYGLDISDYALERAAHFAPGSRCFLGDLNQELPDELERGSFDLVLAKYVFEHLENPEVSMRRVGELLRPGGILLFAVPNTESLGARWKGETWYAHPAVDPTHCSLLAPDEWIDVVNRAGLTIRRETSDGYWDLPYIRWLTRWLQVPSCIGPTALACLAGRAILPPRLGENVIVIASKPAARAAAP